MEISYAGKEMEFVAAHAGLSCIQGRFAWKGLSETQCLTEIGSNDTRGHCEIPDQETWNGWLERLNGVIIGRLPQILASVGPALTQRTATALEASRGYLTAFEFPCAVGKGNETVAKKMTDQHRSQVSSLMSKRVGWLDQPIFHFVAVCAICTFSPVIEPGIKFNYDDPTNDAALMWRIQTIADRLMAYPRPVTIVVPGESGGSYSVREPRFKVAEQFHSV